jgi:hypothetical protein
VGVGLWDYEGYGGLLDHFVVEGRTNSQGWLSATCDATVGATALSADGVIGCNGFTFVEDNTGTMTATAPAGGGQTFARVTASTASINNDGAGIFANGTSAGWLTLASSTPVFEVNARLRNSTATTSQYFIGFTNITSGGTALETAPTIGCWFVASSTQANWFAECRTATGSNTTLVNTGIASTSVTNGTAGTGYQFRKFRIQADLTKAEFFIQATGSSNLIKVAQISTTYPANTLLNAGMHYGIVSQNTSSGFDLFRARFWWKDVLPSL